MKLNEITAVLLADGWHQIDTGSMEYNEYESFEYSWEEAGREYFCPEKSVLAIQT